MSVAVYPGSFDPITNGHLDILERRDDGVRARPHRRPGQPAQDAAARGRRADPRHRRGDRGRRRSGRVRPRSGVAHAFDGLTVDFCHANGATAIVRGLRAISDFETEMQLAHNNRVLAPDVDTVFFMTSIDHGYVSSSLVKEIASFGGDVSAMLPAAAEAALRAALAGR